MAHELTTVSGLLSAVFTCCVAHILMVPLGLDTFTHTIGDVIPSLTDIFGDASGVEEVAHSHNHLDEHHVHAHD